MTAKEANLAYRRVRNKYEEVHLKNAAMELQLKKVQKDYADVDKRHKLQLDKNVTLNNELEGEKKKYCLCKNTCNLLQGKLSDHNNLTTQITEHQCKLKFAEKECGCLLKKHNDSEAQTKATCSS